MITPEERLAKMQEIKKAQVYYVTFRISERIDKKQRSPVTRREKMLKGIEKIAVKGEMWEEPSSYVLFSSAKSIAVVASTIHDNITADMDLAIIGTVNRKAMQYVGNIKNSRLLQKFAPFATRFPR